MVLPTQRNPELSEDFGHGTMLHCTVDSSLSLRCTTRPESTKTVPDRTKLDHYYKVDTRTRRCSTDWWNSRAAGVLQLAGALRWAGALPLAVELKDLGLIPLHNNVQRNCSHNGLGFGSTNALAHGIHSYLCNLGRYSNIVLLRLR